MGAAAVLETGLANVDAMSRAMQAEIKSQVERMADNLFKTIQEKRSHIANNYLSLKGYAGAAQDTIIDYVQKGQGKGLSAIGDFLQTIAVGADIHTKPALGVSAGTGGIVSTFSGDLIPDVKELNKVNGLADEYYSHFADVSARWPYGLGKYLLMKMGDALHKDGVLTVGKKSGASGQWVYLNGHMLGLSHKMDEFEDIACRLTHYQDFLSKLISKVIPLNVSSRRETRPKRRRTRRVARRATRRAARTAGSPGGPGGPGENAEKCPKKLQKGSGNCSEGACKLLVP